MQVLLTKEKTNKLALSGTSLVQTLMTPQKPKESTEKQTQKSPEQILMTQILQIFNKEKSYLFKHNSDGFDATLAISMQSEYGKLNLNSLYDFEKKKFIKEGQPGDRKQLCTWLFDTIATLTKKPSLFSAFEKHLTKRTNDFNDVTELLAIKEFADTFASNIFIQFDKQIPSDTIFLTDIFTIATEEENINPWLFSPSWCKILGLKTKEQLNTEEKNKIFSKLIKNNDWQKDWDNCLKEFYQKDFKDLPQEIKTILTTQFEANIFSLLLKATIGETNSTIFTIVKSRSKDNLILFDIMKTYQL